MRWDASGNFLLSLPRFLESPHVQGALDDVGAVDYEVYVRKEKSIGLRLIECRLGVKVKKFVLDRCVGSTKHSQSERCCAKGVCLWARAVVFAWQRHFAFLNTFGL